MIEKLFNGRSPKELKAYLADGGAWCDIFANFYEYSIKLRIEEDLSKRRKFQKQYTEIEDAIVEAIRYINFYLTTTSFTISYIELVEDNGDCIKLDVDGYKQLVAALINNGESLTINYDPFNSKDRRIVVEALASGDIETIKKYITYGLDLSRPIAILKKDWEESPRAIAEERNQKAMVDFIEKHLEQMNALNEKAFQQSKIRYELASIREENERQEIIKEEQDRKTKEWKEKFADIIIEQPKVKRQLKIESNDGSDYDYFRYLGNGLVAVVGHDAEGYYTAVSAIDIHSGDEKWVVTHCETACGEPAPIYDGKYIYIARDFSSTAISAHIPATGEQLWLCNLSNSYKQFGTPMIQSENYIAICNIDNRKMTIVDKHKGKVVVRAKLKNWMRERSPQPELLAWQDKFITIAVNKKDEFVLDVYDPTVKDAYVKTLGEYPDIARPQVKIIVDNYLYVYSHWGYLCKINLETGALENKAHPNEKVLHEQDDDAAFSQYNFTSEGFYLGENKKLYCILERDDVCTLTIYDTVTDEYIVRPFDDPNDYRNSKMYRGKIYSFVKAIDNSDIVYLYERNLETNELKIYSDPNYAYAGWGNWFIAEDILFVIKDKYRIEKELRKEKDDLKALSKGSGKVKATCSMLYAWDLK